ncbi:hypothetical protein [Halobacterium sp. KA-6]|uniref:hypothetical protein n=1 Tax=Halobacterium sp. KA-6 TaxID=2896368 RepID=UPI001E5F4CB6|nr:hypothetical protein [Halobacterium sp. KA-6]MCD2202740.1 hypothetical protein [Halobacterium sp. KA-6]
MSEYKGDTLDADYVGPTLDGGVMYGDRDLDDGDGVTTEEIDTYARIVGAQDGDHETQYGIRGLVDQLEDESIIPSGSRVNPQQGVLRLGGAINGTFYKLPEAGPRGSGPWARDYADEALAVIKSHVAVDAPSGSPSEGQSWGEWVDVAEADEVTVPNDEMADDAAEQVEQISTGTDQDESTNSDVSTPSNSDSSSVADSAIPVVGLAAALLVAVVLYQMSDS